MDSEHARAIASLEHTIGDPAQGLPEAVFLFVSRVTPLVNVDLLIKDTNGRTLLTWRDDAYYGAGWHVPGGIIRFKEAASDRIRAVARDELGADVVFEPAPIAFHEEIHPDRADRGHFISLLYRCALTSPLDETRRADGTQPQPGAWRWHTGMPGDILDVHQVYGPFIE